MKYILTILSILLFSCGNESQQIDKSGNIDIKENKVVNNDINSDKKAIWKLVVVPIIENKKDKVIQLFEFPLNSEFEILTEVIKKPTSSISFKDFDVNYNKIFNENFKKSLNSKSFRDINSYNENDTLWFTLNVEREIGQTEGGLYLKFFKIKNYYILKGFYGVGADFYYVEE